MELELCPFCGSTAFTVNYEYKLDNGVCKMWFVECNGCHATTFEYDTEKEAIESWNRRIDND